MLSTSDLMMNKFRGSFCLLQPGHFSKTSEYKLQQGYEINVNFRILLDPLHSFLCNKEL